MTNFFNFESVLDAEFDKSIVSVEIYGEKFLVRRMNGTEYADFQANNAKYGLNASVMLSVLSANVYYNEPKPFPIKEVKAEKLIQNRVDLARELIVRIVDLTVEYQSKLTTEKDSIEKN